MQDELAAALLERVDALLRVTRTAWLDGPHDYGEPLHVPRPYEEKPKPRSIRDIFGRHASSLKGGT